MVANIRLFLLFAKYILPFFGEMGKNVTSLKLFATYGKEKDTHNPAKHRFFYLTLQQHLPNKKRHDLQ